MINEMLVRKREASNPNPNEGIMAVSEIAMIPLIPCRKSFGSSSSPTMNMKKIKPTVRKYGKNAKTRLLKIYFYCIMRDLQRQKDQEFIPVITQQSQKF